ncbi:tyrosine-type recombinase/integrase [Bradyrhizobium sp. AUGA SZCCT0182]|uniref:tyrosine-type recombinase/integrase n=1 Tax=Bradyrhizobium sp. AUGA SZCCT0182 TaxID=2807667 RepID=UPI001BACB459|nr:tyrosine-type recombinase/integrase [Bradyrhizobium sp. AUGA SZCCT0182]MBR1237885.1 tyrosine-type recombinase/integrase [Bradyrhizobium sp. AUGA SZCCT0182]
MTRWRWGVPHVDHQVDRHGHPRWWYRRRGEKRLGALPMPGTPDFLNVWKALDDVARGAAMPALGASRTRPGSLSAALVAYYTSPAWTVELAESSRNMRRPILEKLRAKFGDAPLKELRRDHVQALLDKLKPNAQKNWSKALTGLIKFALRAGLIKESPMAGVVKDKAPKTGGLPAWTEDHLITARARYPLGTRQRLAVEIMVNTGLRRSDAYRLGPNDIKGGWVRDFEAKKTARTTGVKINVPVRPELAAAIAAMKTIGTKTFLVTEQGKPFASEASFGNWMRDVYDAAELPDVANHGLRKLAAIRLAFAGVDVWGLMKVFGWKTVAQAQVYVEQAEAMRMAGQAFDKLEAYEAGNATGPNPSQPSPKRLGRKPKN